MRPLSLTDVARELDAPVWAVRRLFERGSLPEPPRVGRLRVFSPGDLPVIRRALVKAGYLAEAAREGA